MKILKNLTCAVAAAGAVAFCATSAKAIETVTDYANLNIAMTVKSIVTHDSGDKDIYTIQSVSYDTAKILTLLESADFNDGAFPAGAKLVVGLGDWEGDILVIDKNGDVLYDASDAETSGSGNAYLSIDWGYEGGPYTFNYLDATPGHYNYTYNFNTVEVELYDDGDQYIDVTTYGNGIETYDQSWNSDDVYKWSVSAHATTSRAGQSINGIDENAAVTINASMNGHGNGDLFY